MASAALQTSNTGSNPRGMNGLPRIDRPNLDTLHQEQAKKQFWKPLKQQTWTECRQLKTANIESWTKKHNEPPSAANQDSTANLGNSRKSQDSWSTTHEPSRRGIINQDARFMENPLTVEYSREIQEPPYRESYSKLAGVVEGCSSWMNDERPAGSLCKNNIQQTWKPSSLKVDKDDEGSGTSRSVMYPTSRLYIKDTSDTAGSRYQGGKPLDQVAAHQKYLRSLVLANSQKATRGVTQPHRGDENRFCSHDSAQRPIMSSGISATKSSNVYYRPKIAAESTKNIHPANKVTPIYNALSTTSKGTIISDSSKRQESTKDYYLSTAPSTPGASTVFLPSSIASTRKQQLPSISSNVLVSPKQRDSR